MGTPELWMYSDFGQAGSGESPLDQLTRRPGRSFSLYQLSLRLRTSSSAVPSDHGLETWTSEAGFGTVEVEQLSATGTVIAHLPDEIEPVRGGPVFTVIKMVPPGGQVPVRSVDAYFFRVGRSRG